MFEVSSRRYASVPESKGDSICCRDLTPSLQCMLVLKCHPENIDATETLCMTVPMHCRARYSEDVVVFLNSYPKLPHSLKARCSGATNAQKHDWNDDAGYGQMQLTAPSRKFYFDTLHSPVHHPQSRKDCFVAVQNAPSETLNLLQYMRSTLSDYCQNNGEAAACHSKVRSLR